MFQRLILALSVAAFLDSVGFLLVSLIILRWPNTVCARFTDSVSDAIKRALGLW